MNRRLSLAFAVLLATTSGFAQVMQETLSDPLEARIVSPVQFVATPSPDEWTEVQGQLPSATLADIASFQGSHGPNWRFYVDRRSGAMSLVEGSGIPWVPGVGNSLQTTGSGIGGKFTVEDLSSKALSMVATYPNLFQVPVQQLVLDRKGSFNSGEKNQYWSIVYRQHINGIPVEASRIIFRVSHGNLVQFGAAYAVPQTLNLKGVQAQISAAQARSALGTHIGGILSGDVFVEDGTLFWTVRGAGDTLGYGGPIGAGWQPMLVYRFRFQRPGSVATWEALVSATTGEIVQFLDSNVYALAKGSAYKVTNCEVPSNCVPGSASEVAVPMPFAKLEFAGGTCSGDGCYTSSAGQFSYPAGAVTAVTSLIGKYMAIQDDCGPIASAGANGGDIDLGTTPANPSGANTDCVSATVQSPPNSTVPTSGGAGDTHSARTMYYHLNLINQKARFYLPTNDWLKGVEGSQGPLPVITNLLQNGTSPPVCNAFWNGSSVNFFKSAKPLFCNNTGEIAGVALHEWGHGMDSFDATGAAPGEKASGEAMGDWFAVLESQISCGAVGFRLQHPTNVWNDTAGYGDLNTNTGSDAESCSGIRDVDYTRYCNHGSASGCIAARDPDAPNGIHAGLTATVPHPSTPDVGTPARWNHMKSDNNVIDGKSAFWRCPTSTTYRGPLGWEGHCESLIASQSLWDFTKYTIRQFGGSIYTPNPLSVSGWQYMDRLWYLTRDLAQAAYRAKQQGPDLVTSGCDVDVWFPTLRFIDDNDGNLANGTPHGDILFKAFDDHAIACGLATDPQNQASGLGPVPVAPTLSSCDVTKSPVQLKWTASNNGVTEYRVLRNTLGCQFGFQPIAVVNAGRDFYEDSDVAPGLPYYYAVQPIGATSSDYGLVSNCVTATPAACATQSIAAPTGLAATAPADAQIQLTWNPVATAQSYKVYRKTGGLNSIYPWEAVGTSLTAGFLDSSVNPSLLYAYRVASSSTTCSACVGAFSTPVEIAATGSCAGTPFFSGVGNATTTAGVCRITVSWSQGAPSCGTSLTYNVYRAKDDPNFTPDASNLVASGITALTYEDNAVSGAIPYYYIVRAVDDRNISDTNLIRRSAIVGTAFAGVAAVSPANTASCRLTLTWTTITPLCNTITYSVYRSTDPQFVPDASNRVASGLTTGTYQDDGVVAGTRYFYVVRAVDATGATDGNTIRRYEVPGGPLAAGTYTDDAGDTGLAKFFPSADFASNDWAIRASATGNTTKVYATTASGNYDHSICHGLVSDTINLAANPVLTFRSRIDVENTWDGGIVEVSTEAGGFTNWTKLETLNYPSAIASPLTDPACNHPGMTDGSRVFAGDCAGPAGCAWASYTGALSQYNNMRIRLRFLFGTDEATNGQGWFIDDISITNAMVPGACTTIAIGRLSDAAYAALETAGSLTVTVLRENATTGTFSVNYATSDGTATAGSDYTASSGTLSFADGETSKTFTIPLLDDAIVEAAETINITLSSPTGGSLGSPATGVVTLTSDDVGGVIDFQDATFATTEGTTATITAVRSGGSAEVSVNYATSDGSAVAGSDYTAASGTLNFGAGETVKTFTVAVTDDAVVESNETVNLTLSGAGGGATLGSTTAATLTIADNDSNTLPTIGSLNPSTVCQGSGGITVTLSGSNFVSGAVVQFNGADRFTTFVSPTEMRFALLSTDTTTAGDHNVRVINPGNVVSDPKSLTVSADSVPPVVTAPAAILVMQTSCSGSNGGATGSSSPDLGNFLAGGSAIDACSAATRLSPQVNGADATNATFFNAGLTTVSFRFRDSAGNIASATSQVTVRLFADLNLNNTVDATDLNLMANYLVGNVTPGTAPFTAPVTSADTDRDGKADAVDIVIQANYLVGNISCLPTR